MKPFAVLAIGVALASWLTIQAAGPHWTVVAWNDLGMHCVDGNDYSVFSILPPFNDLHAQLIDPNGKLVSNPTGITLSYRAVADPTGSINRTSAAKTNFWEYVQPLFGVALAPDVGLAGNRMPGANNALQPMTFDATRRWFAADGIPILPYDDAGKKNYYPMMQVVARSGSTILATTKVVLPVSDEMDCTACHASGSTSTAAPQKGWVYDSNKTRDYKRNILRIHDERKPAPAAMLAKAGYNAGGLEATYTSGTPILCDRCHASNALPGTGYAGVSPLTRAMHDGHATAIDPTAHVALGASENRDACYRCHPGSVTKCLRGVMGNAKAPDGSMAMQCQSCHGGMSDVGAAARNGWLEEPNCQACHTGTALANNGQIRYTSALTAGGSLRVALDHTFATTPNTPAAGVSLYRFSTGHGGLQCEACHGSTHAEYPSSHTNDNLQNIALQGYAGVLAECGVCHANASNLSATGGPHGMHPIGQSWVSRHGDLAENGRAAQCRACHGLDYRGTVLSKVRTARSFAIEERAIKLAAGTQVGCYNCHNGPNGGD